MSTDQIILFGCIVGLIILLVSELTRPSMAFFGVAIVLTACEIITPSEALQGFANEQLLVIVLLLTMSQILSRSRIFDHLMEGSLKTGISSKGFLGRIVSIVGLSSSFLNNTPLVAIMLPVVNRWADKANVKPSKLLIPLSYASILGGCMTLVGTSTNLVVNGLAVNAGAESLKMFDFLPVGGAMMLIGGLYILLFHSRLLPERPSPLEQVRDGEREYFLEAHVNRTSPLVGKTIEEGGLRNLKNLFLAEIDRGGEMISPVGPTETLRGGDRLFFVGRTGAVVDLSRPELGLSWPEEASMEPSPSGSMVELVVGYNAEIVGRTVKDSGFRGNYDGVIMAVHRNGTRLSGKIGDLLIHAGDVLLVRTGPDFSQLVKAKRDLYILSSSGDPSRVENSAYLVLMGLVLCLGLTFAGVSLALSLSLLLLVSLALKLTNTDEIRRSLDFELIVVIALGLSLGKAMTDTGSAQFLADGIHQLRGWGPWVTLGTLFVLTNVLGSLITSKAAVAVTLPVALALASANAHPTAPYVLVTAFAGAASFISPIGYQTNLMVYGPGNYRFRDFFRFGIPLTLLYLLVTVSILTYTYLI